VLPAKLVVSLHLKSNGTIVVRQARAKYPRFWFQCRSRWLVCKAFEQLPGFAVILKWLLGKESD